MNCITLPTISGVRRDRFVQPQRGGQLPQPSPVAIWLLLAGVLLIPSNITVHLVGDGAKFTPGRFVIALLVIPALVTFLRGSRRVLFADIFAIIAAAWMIGSRVRDDGLNPSAVAEVIEFLGGYGVGRAFVFGPLRFEQFVQILKKIAVAVILLAILDPLVGDLAVQKTTEVIFQSALTPAVPQFRMGLVRATSTFSMAELYGLFCCSVGALLLFFESTTRARVLWVGFCFFGCLLSLSSGPILTFALIVSFFAYDRLLNHWYWRWKALSLAMSAFLIAVFLIVDQPVRWLVSHMTLDPETGFFRMYVFDYAFHNISLSPIVGYGFRDDIGDDDFLAKASVDNVWIVLSLRFGIPVAIFLLLANVSAFFPLGLGPRLIGSRTHLAGTGFTFVLMAFMLVGVTVHFWDSIWMFWSICLGVRASIKEWATLEEKRSGFAVAARAKPHITAGLQRARSWQVKGLRQASMPP